MSTSQLYIGVMSGTSLDGIDTVLADFSEFEAGRKGPRLVAHSQRNFAPELRTVLGALQSSGREELHRAAVVSQHLARSYAQAIVDLLQHAGVEADEVRAAGIHGQTVRHQPESGYTIQLNAPATVAELTGIDVVADFRSRDIAAGGQGAPLASGFHAAALRAPFDRTVVNIGGIANLTGIPALNAEGSVIGFDSGPGNVLLDLWHARHRNGNFDPNGELAASGKSDSGLLEHLLKEPYFGMEPPKSTGRDLFNVTWLDRKLTEFDPDSRIEPQDVQATLCRLTASSIARAMRDAFPGTEQLVVCGGGAFNGELMRMIAEEAAPVAVIASGEVGIAPDHVEALAFAWLAREHMEGRPGNLPSVTGAKAPRILGASYPK